MAVFKCDECGGFANHPRQWRVVEAKVFGDHVESVCWRYFHPGEVLRGDVYVVCSRKCHLMIDYRLSQQMPGNDERCWPKQGGIWHKEDEVYAALQEIFPHRKGRPRKPTDAVSGHPGGPSPETPEGDADVRPAEKKKTGRVVPLTRAARAV